MLHAQESVGLCVASQIANVLQGKSCLLAINKVDAADALPRPELDGLLGVSRLPDVCTVSLAGVGDSATHEI